MAVIMLPKMLDAKFTHGEEHHKNTKKIKVSDYRSTKAYCCLGVAKEPRRSELMEQRELKRYNRRLDYLNLYY